ncbi:MAG: hypothetical protein J5I93_22145 [Pirellulaceae bacterium]|nr:hypothetical protein [Pirellulaceae bacterium]
MSAEQSRDESPVALVGLLAWLTLALAVVFPGFAWFGYSSHGAVGLQAAAIAAGICWLGAAGALSSAFFFRHAQQAMSALVLGMLFRMGLPLGCVLALLSQGGPLVDAGIVGLIVVYYLVSLVVETALSLRLVGLTRQVTKAS